MADLYVYYKVRSGDAAALAALAARVRSLQAGLGVPAALKRRPDERDGLQTWMEVYPAAADGFALQLAAAVDAAGLLDAIVGPRHAEVFVDLPGDAPCA